MVKLKISMEDEIASLIEETRNERERVTKLNESGLTSRKLSLEIETPPGDETPATKGARKSGFGTEVEPRPNGNSYLKSYPAFLLYACAVVIVLMWKEDIEIVHYEKSMVSGEEHPGSTMRGVGFHDGNTFGNKRNLAHSVGLLQRLVEDGNGATVVEEPSIVRVDGLAVESLNALNAANEWGHYAHDEHRSPYSSFLYDQPIEVLKENQAKYEKKMARVRKEWGAWNFSDDGFRDFQSDGARPVANFSVVAYGDMKNADMPDGCWQKDEAYVRRYLEEAKSLVTRVREGIYAEYGSPLKKSDGTTLGEKERAERAEKWKIHVIPDDHPNESSGAGIAKGIAFLHESAMEALVRKLLHAIVTNDYFFAMLAGHSAAAGHGNNWHQTKFVSFHHLMEPVMDKLGMRLISRNMAMGGVGTLQFNLAGKDYYGEGDIVEWDSGMTEKGPTVDLFNIQQVLTGERVPVILTMFRHGRLYTNHSTWFGNFLADYSMIPETVDEVQAKSLPYAARWINEKLPAEKYNAICWEPRIDVVPPKAQTPAPGGASWHPGFRQHQWSGRKLSLIILEALGRAFDLWQEQIDKPKDQGGGFPLDESHWHVGPSYKELRSKLLKHISTPQNPDVRTYCESYLFPRVCRQKMKGFGLWTPRVHDSKSLLNIIHRAPPDDYLPQFKEPVYTSIDVLPLNQEIPDGEVDVHAIAIASSNPPFGNANDEHAKILTKDWVDGDFQEDFNITSETTITRGTLLSLYEEARAKYSPPSNSTQRGLSPPRHSLAAGIVPGIGWVTHGWKPSKGFCDGSSESRCERDDTNNCLRYGANDNHLDVMGNALSGWLIMTVPKVEEGIVLARIECWCHVPNSVTAGWKEVNNGRKDDRRYLQRTPSTPLPPFMAGHPLSAPYSDFEQEDHYRTRRLKPTQDQLVPKDFEMDIAINGKITTMKRDQWLPYTAEPSKNCAAWPLLDDAEWSKKTDEEKENVEVAIRFRSKLQPTTNYCVSHLYYA